MNAFVQPQELIKDTSVKATLERGNEKPNRFQENHSASDQVLSKTEWFSSKPSGFLFFFFSISIPFFNSPNFVGCVTLNFVLIKNIKMDSNFFRMFYFKNLKISNLTDHFW
jgi:hypothetical protein